MTTTKKPKRRQLTSFQVIIFGFLSVILLGSLLLMLPFATKEGIVTNFSDTLFTATSAVCVTGLIVYDTATYWSEFGQLVILTLIQIGGMGVVTISIAIVAASGRKIGLMQRSIMQESISAHQVGGIIRMTRFILKTSFFIELTGALLLMPVFCRDFGIFKGVWYSFFHSISAFCNAGFDLMGVKTQFSSLTSYSGSYLVNFTIMALIVLGGLGFLTWADIGRNKLHFRKYTLQTKAILTVTFILLSVPAVYFFFAEFNNLAFGERVLNSMFQSVTTRTAGFNTADLTLISETGIMIMILLMIVGGSPGSTAGGMKTTTVAALIAAALSIFRKQDSVHLFHRRIPDSVIKHAVTILLLYLTLFLTGGMIISSIENVPLLSALFETGSAIATVGLSLGLTPSLGLISKLILITLMFFGRVGGLTLIFAALSQRNTFNSRYPEEKITVG